VRIFAPFLSWLLHLGWKLPTLPFHSVPSPSLQQMDLFTVVFENLTATGEIPTAPSRVL
jgi:hypothetical protein